MAVAHRCEPGKIATLCDLIAEHEDAFIYDWRTRFHLPLEVVFDGRMSWAESWGLLCQLAPDPTSRVGAAMEGLGLPVDLSTVVLADIWDALVQINSRKGSNPKPYPRPWSPARMKRTGTTLTQAQIRQALRDRGHDV